MSAAGLWTASACQLHARSPEEYRRDTRALLDTRKAETQSCYDEALRIDPKAAGTVVVRFTIADGTGAITSAQVLPESTAPAPLGDCVILALHGLTLEPPDEREGHATLVWNFDRS